MSKTQRIEALEAEVDDLNRRRPILAQRIADLERPAPTVQPQPFADRVRSEFADRWGWLGDLVGL